MNRLFTAITLVALSTLVSTLSRADLNRFHGPLSIRNSRAVNRMFLRFTPDSPFAIESGNGSTEVRLDAVNSLLTSSSGKVHWVEDFEEQIFAVRHKRAISHHMDISLEGALVWRNGGILDGVMNLWHRLWGIGGTEDVPVGRQNIPEYQARLDWTDPNRGINYHLGSAFGLSDTSMFLKRTVSTTSRMSHAVRFGVKLPTGNPALALGSGNVDAGLAFTSQYQLNSATMIYGEVAGTLNGRPRYLPGAHRGSMQWFIAAEMPHNSRDTWVLQWDAATPVLRSGAGFPDQLNATLTLAFRRMIGSRELLTLAASENGDFHNYRLPFLGSVGPDITISVGWTRIP